MTWRQIRVLERRTMFEMRQACVIFLYGIMLRVMIPRPTTDLKESHFGRFLGTFNGVQIGLMQFATIDETRLLQD